MEHQWPCSCPGWDRFCRRWAILQRWAILRMDQTQPGPEGTSKQQMQKAPNPSTLTHIYSCIRAEGRLIISWKRRKISWSLFMDGLHCVVDGIVSHKNSYVEALPIWWYFRMRPLGGNESGPPWWGSLYPVRTQQGGGCLQSRKRDFTRA